MYVYVYVYTMATKTITITEEAYKQLKEHKREGESFTDTILRLTETNEDVMKGFGVMREIDGFRDAVEKTRDELNHDLQERANR